MNRTKRDFWLIILGAAVLLGLVVAAAYGQNVVIPPGSVTDCGEAYSSYFVNTSVTVNVNSPDVDKKLRWGPMYGIASTSLRCFITEAEGVLPTMYADLHNIPPAAMTWQDGQDLGLIVGMGASVALQYCQQIGPCSPLRPEQITRDDQGWCPRRPGVGSDPRNCFARADWMNCGINTGWNVYWNYTYYLDNKAPHCVPVSGACPVGQSCQGPCVQKCTPNPLPQIIVDTLNQARGWTIIGSGRRAALTKAYIAAAAYKPCVESTAKLEMVLSDEVSP